MPHPDGEKSMMPQKIVILGGTGFVGQHLVQRLSSDGHSIVVLSRNHVRRREVGAHA